MGTKTTDVLTKIQLLLNKAESTNSEHEAAALWEAAQKLMTRHAIDESMLPGNSEKREPIVTRIIKLNPRDEIFMAKAHLVQHLAEANRCKMFITKSLGHITVVGYESDAAFTEMLYASVMIQYATARNRGWKEYQGVQSRYLWVNAFAQGYAQRIGERLREQSAADAKSTGQELVLRDRTKDVEDYLSQNFRLGKGRVTKYRGGEGHNAGRRAANSANLTGGRNNLSGGSGRAIGH